MIVRRIGDDLAVQSSASELQQLLRDAGFGATVTKNHTKPQFQAEVGARMAVYQGLLEASYDPPAAIADDFDSMEMLQRIFMAAEEWMTTADAVKAERGHLLPIESLLVQCVVAYQQFLRTNGYKEEEDQTDLSHTLSGSTSKAY